jgi:hypothetical protein
VILESVFFSPLSLFLYFTFTVFLFLLFSFSLCLSLLITICCLLSAKSPDTQFSFNMKTISNKDKFQRYLRYENHLHLAFAMQTSRHSISLLVVLTVKSWLLVQRPLMKHLGCSAWLVDTTRRKSNRRSI